MSVVNDKLMTDVYPIIQVNYDTDLGINVGWEAVAIPPRPTWGSFFDHLKIIGHEERLDVELDDEIGDHSHHWFTLNELKDYLDNRYVGCGGIYLELLKWYDLGTVVRDVYGGEVRYVFGFIS